MLVMFAVGVAGLPWMVLLTALMIHEGAPPSAPAPSRLPASLLPGAAIALLCARAAGAIGWP
jgi:predicted metal-binding membrane protein